MINLAGLVVFAGNTAKIQQTKKKKHVQHTTPTAYLTA